MQAFGSFLRIAGWLFTLGPIVLIAVLMLAFIGGARPSEVQFAQGLIAIVTAALVLPAGLIALVAGYLIKWLSADGRSRASAAGPHDPLDPDYLLRNPPAGSQLMNEHGRRVVVLADGGVIGQLLSGRAQRFASLKDFREFVGS
jgi:hypothetical protein